MFCLISLLSKYYSDRFRTLMNKQSVVLSNAKKHVNSKAHNNPPASTLAAEPEVPMLDTDPVTPGAFQVHPRLFVLIRKHGVLVKYMGKFIVPSAPISRCLLLLQKMLITTSMGNVIAFLQSDIAHHHSGRHINSEKHKDREAKHRKETPKMRQSFLSSFIRPPTLSEYTTSAAGLCHGWHSFGPEYSALLQCGSAPTMLQSDSDLAGTLDREFEYIAEPAYSASVTKKANARASIPELKIDRGTFRHNKCLGVLSDLSMLQFLKFYLLTLSITCKQSCNGIQR